jgi:ferritin-like metal-binding protein YciE
MADKDLNALFVHQLKDTYFAENAILKGLPQLAEAAQSEELKGRARRPREGNRRAGEAPGAVFEIVGAKPEGVECKAIQGIIAEGQEVLSEFREGEALDAGLIAAAQAIEHYEITRYGTLLAWAKQLGLSEAEGLLQETLVEEENTDEVLSELAEDAINPCRCRLRGRFIRAVLRGGPHPTWPSSTISTVSALVKATREIWGGRGQRLNGCHGYSGCEVQHPR